MFVTTFFAMNRIKNDGRTYGCGNGGWANGGVDGMFRSVSASVTTCRSCRAVAAAFSAAGGCSNGWTCRSFGTVGCYGCADSLDGATVFTTDGWNGNFVIFCHVNFVRFTTGKGYGVPFSFQAHTRSWGFTDSRSRGINSPVGRLAGCYGGSGNVFGSRCRGSYLSSLFTYFFGLRTRTSCG